MNYHSVQRGVHMEITRVSIQTIYRNIVNLFITKGETLTLIDAGFKSEEGKQQVEDALRTMGYTLADVEQVVLTHHHPDHCGLVDAFPNATIVGHPYCNHFLQPTEAFFAYYEKFHLHLLAQHGIHGVDAMLQDFMKSDMEHFGTNPVTHFLAHGDEVPGMPGFVAHYTPGHCQSHLIYVNEQTGVSFGGDLILDTISPNPFVEPPLDLSLERESSILKYHASLAHTKELAIDALYTGHGEVVTDVRGRVAEILAEQRARAQKVQTFFEKGQRYTTVQIAKQLFGPVFFKQPALTLSETLAQLDYLVQQQALDLVRDNETYYYTLRTL